MKNVIWPSVVVLMLCALLAVATTIFGDLWLESARAEFTHWTAIGMVAAAFSAIVIGWMMGRLIAQIVHHRRRAADSLTPEEEERMVDAYQRQEAAIRRAKEERRAAQSRSADALALALGANLTPQGFTYEGHNVEWCRRCLTASYIQMHFLVMGQRAIKCDGCQDYVECPADPGGFLAAIIDWNEMQRARDQL